jgi:type I restriction enzyme, S subunit
VGEWRSTTIGDVVSLQRGYDITKLAQRPGLVPVVSASGVQSYHDTALAKAPGVLLARKGNGIGMAHYIDQDYWPHDTTLWVTDFHGNDPEFVYYLFRWLAPRLATLDVGSANPTLNRNHIHLMTVRCPDVYTQRRIAEILGALHDKIELNRRLSETLEATARALFRKHLDDAATTAPLNSVAFGDVGGILREAVDPQSAADTEFLHFSLPAYDNGRQPVLQFGSAIRSIKTIVPPGSVLVSKLNPEIERVWLPDIGERGRAVSSTEFLVLRPRAPFGRAFLYELARSGTFRRDLEALTTGTSNSHQRARPGSILAIPVLVPDAQHGAAFERVAGALLDRVASSARQVVLLGAIRDALLPRLLSGELAVSDPE